MNQLLNIFYRIDLDEKKVNNILTFSPPDKIASELCELVIKREMKKEEMRRKFS
jgi:hypothetical protein